MIFVKRIPGISQFIAVLSLFIGSACHQSAEKKVDALRNTEFTTGYAPVNGLRMYYEIHGEGAMPLVLIHGGGSTIETTFGTILPMLERHRQVIALELQAHGRTSDRDSAESFDQDADDVAALMQFLKIPKADFFGFSNGGNTAMKIAIRHPQLVNKLIVASSFYKRSGFIPGFFEGMQNATLENMPAQLKTGYIKVAPDKNNLQVMFNKDRERMMNVKDWTEDDLRSITMPALLIGADHDVVLPAHVAEMSLLMPHARLMILPGTHGSYIGEICSMKSGSRVPKATVTFIEEFLDE